MLFRHQDGTSVRVACHVDVPTGDVVGRLDRSASLVRRRLGANRLAVSLWLPAPVIDDLVTNRAALRRLRRALAARALDVVTLDGFRYDASSGHAPDWADPRRLAHTLASAQLLTELLPDDMFRGSVTTLPLGWRTPWSAARHSAARRALDDLADGLAELHWSSGRRIRVGLVPEPGCVVASTPQAISELSAVDNEWIGVALDTAHLAMAFESPDAVTRRLGAACVPVVQARVSSAAQIAAADAGTLDPAAYASAFADGFRFDVDSLAEGVAGGLPADRPWRVHAHLPVSGPPDPPVTATADVTAAALEALFDPVLGAQTDYVEVGAAVPLGPDPVGLLSAELAWTRDRLIGIGLKES
jgi:sugar phosphate isomerase/epimerase